MIRKLLESMWKYVYDKTSKQQDVEPKIVRTRKTKRKTTKISPCEIPGYFVLTLISRVPLVVGLA
jgi:hypothetical protein